MKRLFVFLLFIIFSSNVFGGVTDNIINGCSLSQNFIANFQNKTIVCQQNTYLPADAETCAPCLSGHVCSGGTFVFDENTDQGIILDTIFYGTIQKACPLLSNNMYATFALKSIACNPGYYLGADDETCTICPVNNKCVGGTFTFSATINQGIESCNGEFAPSGSVVCYPHVLHVGDDVVYLSATKRTTPSLNVEVNGTVFYANITPTPTVMSVGSQHYFKTIYNDAEQYICDDSVWEK